MSEERRRSNTVGLPRKTLARSFARSLVVVKSTMLLAYRLSSEPPEEHRVSHARTFVWALRNRSRLPTRTPFSRRSAEGPLGVETITPYTCSGLMVREYYIRIWNTPDNKGGESTVVVWHWYGKSRPATRNGGWGMGNEGATESTVIYRVLWNRWDLTSRYITSYNIL